MGEIKINPILNVHQNYNRVNIVNPYRYGSGGGDPVGGVDADYQAVLDFASNNAIPLPSSAQQDLDNQLMIDYKATGAYAKRDAILKANGTADPNFKLICWKRKIKMIAYGGLTWDEFGVLPNGTTGHIDPLYNTTLAENYLLNDAGIDWVEVSPSTDGAITGGYSGVLDDYTIIIPKGGSVVAAINKYTALTQSYSQTGYTSVNRGSASQVVCNGGQLTLNHNSQKKWENKLFLFARSRTDNSTMDLFYNGKVSFVSIGGSVLNEYNALKTLFG